MTKFKLDKLIVMVCGVCAGIKKIVTDKDMEKAAALAGVLVCAGCTILGGQGVIDFAQKLIKSPEKRKLISDKVLDLSKKAGK